VGGDSAITLIRIAWPELVTSFLGLTTGGGVPQISRFFSSRTDRFMLFLRAQVSGVGVSPFDDVTEAWPCVGLCCFCVSNVDRDVFHSCTQSGQQLHPGLGV
jgi:hypothetical protein